MVVPPAPALAHVHARSHTLTRSSSRTLPTALTCSFFFSLSSDSTFCVAVALSLAGPWTSSPRALACRTIKTPSAGQPPADEELVFDPSFQLALIRVCPTGYRLPPASAPASSTPVRSRSPR